jgi:mono/diheme cytochrome c family protein
MIDRSRQAQSSSLRSGLLLLGVALLVPAGLSTRALGSQDAAAKSVKDGVYSTEQSQRGRTLAEAGCVSCHGNQLTGNDVGPSLHGPDFQAVWSGKSAADLFEKILTTMPADGPGTLKPQQAADLVAYIFELNNFPSGPNELPSEKAQLGLVQIRTEK